MHLTTEVDACRHDSDTLVLVELQKFATEMGVPAYQSQQGTYLTRGMYGNTIGTRWIVGFKGKQTRPATKLMVLVSQAA